MFDWLPFWVSIPVFPVTDVTREITKGYSCCCFHFEEVGCQAHGWRSRLSGLWETLFRWESCWGSEFSWRESNKNYRAIRILVWPIVEALEGRWSSQWTMWQWRCILLGWDRHVGNESLWVVGVSGSLRRIHLLGWSLVLAWGWITVESDEKHGIWLGGSWKVCM